MTSLYSFCAQPGCADGGNPYAGLVQGSDGNFYGTTFGRGANGYGTVFKITPAGALTSLHSFTGADGQYPYAGLVQATDGDLYGTTPEGGAGAYHLGGTVFKVTPSGTLTTLYNFCSLPACADGDSAHAVLVQATDGNFYGTTGGGGAYCTANSGCGTAFKMTPSGSLTTLHSFDGSDGKGTSAGLVQATDGNFYGTTAYGANPACTAGLGGCGTVFRLSGPPPSTTTVTSSPNPSTFGQQVTITATVGPAGPPAPTGTVGFTSNGTAISGCTSVTLNSGTAQCVTSSLSVGTDRIVATYSGDSNYSGSSGTFSQLVEPVPLAVQFVPVTPCRLVDTRNPMGEFGGPPIEGGIPRSFPIPQQTPCDIPSTAAAYSLNVTLVPLPGGRVGFLTIWPTGEGQPNVSTMNSYDGRFKANAAIVPAGTNGAVSVYSSNTTDVVLDIEGYFEPVGDSTLAFYPLKPCRVADRRNANGPLGGP